MAQLEAALEDTLSGHGRLVMLVGEPGIGKTHILRCSESKLTSTQRPMVHSSHAVSGAPRCAECNLGGPE